MFTEHKYSTPVATFTPGLLVQPPHFNQFISHPGRPIRLATRRGPHWATGASCGPRNLVHVVRAHPTVWVFGNWLWLMSFVSSEDLSDWSGSYGPFMIASIILGQRLETADPRWVRPGYLTWLLNQNCVDLWETVINEEKQCSTAKCILQMCWK